MGELNGSLHVAYYPGSSFQMVCMDHRTDECSNRCLNNNKSECVMKWYMKYITYGTAAVKSNELWSSQLWTQFESECVIYFLTPVPSFWHIHIVRPSGIHCTRVYVATHWINAYAADDSVWFVLFQFRVIYPIKVAIACTCVNHTLHSQARMTKWETLETLLMLMKRLFE